MGDRGVECDRRNCSCAWLPRRYPEIGRNLAVSPDLIPSLASLLSNTYLFFCFLPNKCFRVQIQMLIGTFSTSVLCGISKKQANKFNSLFSDDKSEMKRTLVQLTEIRPNLIFRKAKMAKKSVEKYAAKKFDWKNNNRKTMIQNRNSGITRRSTVRNALGFGSDSGGKERFLCSLHEENDRVRRGAWIGSIESYRKRAEKDVKIQEILEKLESLRIQRTLLSDDQLDRLTEYQLHNVSDKNFLIGKRSEQGICMDASPLQFLNFEVKTVGIFVDKVLDPGNLGAIGRSAWYFGVDGIGFAKGRGWMTRKRQTKKNIFQTESHHTIHEQIVLWCPRTSSRETIWKFPWVQRCEKRQNAKKSEYLFAFRVSS